MIYQGKRLYKVKTKAYPEQVGYTDAVKTYACSLTPAYFIVYPEISNRITPDDYWGFFEVSDCELLEPIKEGVKS